MNTLGLIVLRLVKLTNGRYALEDYVKVDGKMDNCSYESFESVYKDTFNLNSWTFVKSVSKSDPTKRFIKRAAFVKMLVLDVVEERKKVKIKGRHFVHV